MKRFNFSVNFVISIIIVLGFCLTTAFSYFSFQKLFRDDVEAVSELTSENIYVNINNLMDRPMNVSLTMANDTFLRGFMNSEEDKLQTDNVETIKAYLSSYQQKYDFDSVFFVSTKTGAYYHYANGIDRMMVEGDPENVWYYSFLEDSRECALNVDNDQAKGDDITIFVNCKLYDENENILGVVGVGMETPYFQKFLSENEDKYGTQAFLIDMQGKIELSSSLTGFEEVNLFEMDGFESMKDVIVNPTENTQQRWYHSKKADGYVISKYVPNLNWYLVVQKNIVDFKDQVIRQLSIGMLFVLLIVAAVVSIVSTINRKNKRALINLARVDQLTGIKNRTSYEQEMAEYKLRLKTYTNFGIGVFDLNNLKKVNDVLGHQAGDQYIKLFSDLACRTFDRAEAFRIGGDEFAFVFVDITEEEMLTRLQVLMDRIQAEKIGDIRLSAAFGYAFYGQNGANDIDLIFKAADNNMYIDKALTKKGQRGMEKDSEPC